MYGIDLGDEELLTRRRWPWLRTRLLGLLSADTRLARVLIPRSEDLLRNRAEQV